MIALLWTLCSASLAQEDLGPTADERNTMAVAQKGAPTTLFVLQGKWVDHRRVAGAVPQGSGSGILWDDQGHIVTNAHVVANGDRFRIMGPALVVQKAKLVGVDPATDIAVLKAADPLDGTVPADLRPVEEPLQVGQKAVALGHPYGLAQTLTVGVVSGLGRDADRPGGAMLRDLVQMDADVNPGNSGGPLLDSSGRVIGMNTLTLAPEGSSGGLGFAIPVSTLRRIVPELIEHGRVERPGLGVELLPASISRKWGVEGLIVDRVLPDTAAQAAGLEGLDRQRTRGSRVRDVLVGVSGKPVRTAQDLFDALEGAKAGDLVQIEVRRGEQTRTVAVALTANRGA